MPSSSWVSSPSSPLISAAVCAARTATECATIAGLWAGRARRREPGRGRGRSASAPGGRVSSRRSTLLCDCPCRTNTSRPLTVSPPAVSSASGTPRRAAAAPHRRPIPSAMNRDSARLHNVRCSALSASATASSSMWPDTIQKEDVCAQLLSGGPGFDPGEVDVADRELRQRRRPARRAHCRGAARPMCGRRPCGAAAARAARPARIGCARWARRRRRWPAPSGRSVRPPAPCSRRRRRARRRHRTRPPRSSWPAPTCAFGRCSVSQCRTCAAATGKAATVATLAAGVPRRTTIVNDTSRVSSAKICSGVPVARLSSVGSTDPSIEFSIGTQA